MTTPPGRYGLIDWRDLPAPRTVSAYQTVSSVQLLTGIGLITAVSMDNPTASGGAAAHAYLYDGTDTTGDLIVALGATGGGGDSVSPGLPGIPFRRGVYLYINAGTATICVTYIPLPGQLE